MKPLSFSKKGARTLGAINSLAENVGASKVT